MALIKTTLLLAILISVTGAFIFLMQDTKPQTKEIVKTFSYESFSK